MGDGPGAMAATWCLLALVWWGPGWLLGEALGVARLLLPAAAPAIGIGLLSLVGWGDRLLHVPWTLPWALGQCAVLAALAWAVRGWAGHRRASRVREPLREDGQRTSAQREERRWWLAGLLGLLPGAVAAGYVWVGGTAGLRAVNQDWDMPWHASLVRLIAATQEWDPRLAAHLSGYDTTAEAAPMGSYPIGFHAVLALVWPGSGASIPVLFDVATLLLVTVQLPLSAMALTWVVVRRPIAVAAAGAASPCVAVAPWDLLWRGPVVRYLAGLLLVGPFILLAVRGTERRAWVWLPGAALAALGLAAVHPSLLAVAAPVLGCWWAARLLPWRRCGAPTTAYVAALAGGAALVSLPVVLDLAGEARRVAAVTWPPDTTLPGAVKDVVLLRHAGSPSMLPLAAAAALGVLALVLGRWVGGVPGAWYLPPVVLFAGLSVATIGTRATWVLGLTAPFYDDQWRIMAAYVVLVIPLVGAGVWFLGRLVATGLGRLPHRTMEEPLRQRVGLGAAVTALVLALVLSLPALPVDQHWVARQNRVSGRTLSSAEIRLLGQVARWVPFDATVLDDACDGAAWMYALGDRMPMIRHYGVPPTRRQKLLLTSFARIGQDPQVRRAAAELGVTFVYVSDGRVRRWDRRPPGLLGLDRLPFLTLVARDGPARLYRLDWSRLPGGTAPLTAAAPTRVHRAGVPGTWSTTDPSPVVPGRSVCS
ncbi:MAG: DUF6541 family protein [Motilibacteraceae bacterium]